MTLCWYGVFLGAVCRSAFNLGKPLAAVTRCRDFFREGSLRGFAPLPVRENTHLVAGVCLAISGLGLTLWSPCPFGLECYSESDSFVHFDPPVCGLIDLGWLDVVQRLEANSPGQSFVCCFVEIGVVGVVHVFGSFYFW